MRHHNSNALAVFENTAVVTVASCYQHANPGFREAEARGDIEAREMLGLRYNV